MSTADSPGAVALAAEELACCGAVVDCSVMGVIVDVCVVTVLVVDDVTAAVVVVVVVDDAGVVVDAFCSPLVNCVLFKTVRIFSDNAEFNGIVTPNVFELVSEVESAPALFFVACCCAFSCSFFLFNSRSIIT